MTVIAFQAKPVGILWSPKRRTRASWRIGAQGGQLVAFKPHAGPEVIPEPETRTDYCVDSTITRTERRMPKPPRAEPRRIAGLKFQPLKQRFAGANVYFDLETQEAYSYSWWRFVERIGPYLVFNDYHYSVTTAKQQSQVRSLLSELGLTIDYTIDCPQGLKDLESATTFYTRRITKLEETIAAKGTRKAKNFERQTEVLALRAKIAVVAKLIAIKAAEMEARAKAWEAQA